MKLSFCLILRDNPQCQISYLIVEPSKWFKYCMFTFGSKVSLSGDNTDIKFIQNNPEPFLNEWDLNICDLW